MKEGIDPSSGGEQLKVKSDAMNEGKIPEGQPGGEAGGLSPEQQDINDALLPDDGKKPHPESFVDPDLVPREGEMAKIEGAPDTDIVAGREIQPDAEVASAPWEDLELADDGQQAPEGAVQYAQDGKETASEGKGEFYPKAEKDLEGAGFEVHNEGEYTGQSKPDYVATKDGETYVGETKSPQECNTAKSGWLTDQPNDSQRMHDAREHARERVVDGLSKDVAAHEAVIDGQIPDYADKMRDGRVRNLPEDVNTDGPMKGAYTVPASEAGNVEAAFDDLEKSYEKVEGENGTVTYTFDLTE